MHEPTMTCPCCGAEFTKFLAFVEHVKTTTNFRCCGAEFNALDDFLEHVDTTINEVVLSTGIIEGHPHDVCECPDCERVRKLYPPEFLIDVGGGC